MAYAISIVMNIIKQASEWGWTPLWAFFFFFLFLFCVWGAVVFAPLSFIHLLMYMLLALALSLEQMKVGISSPMATQWTENDGRRGPGVLYRSIEEIQRRHRLWQITECRSRICKCRCRKSTDAFASHIKPVVRVEKFLSTWKNARGWIGCFE